MKKIVLEILLCAGLVFIPTFFVYSYLKGFPSFWNAQFVWSVILAAGWVLVATGYYNQGWLVKTDHTSKDVSIILPITVFIVQCVLFVKGIYYHDWSLIWGALVVNSGVVFSLYQIAKSRKLF